MYRKNLAAIDCSTARALDQVGEWWSLMIVRECTLGTTRFDELQKRLGIARNVLTSRLNHLIDQEIVSKVPVNGNERFYEYQLTPKGEALYPVLVALMQWGDRWTGDGAGGPIGMLEQKTGKQIAIMGPRVENGPLLGFRDIRFEARPNASSHVRKVIADRNRDILGVDETLTPDADTRVRGEDRRNRKHTGRM
jgi:DNA-binding HxlR family transcriptional regulator